MKNFGKNIAIALLLVVSGLSVARAQVMPSAKLQDNPWKETQLMQPSVLAGMIKEGKKVRILNIGVVQDIKGSVHIGAAGKEETFDKLVKLAKTLPKDELVVIYCGCCPFEKCPNIRPAFNEMKKQRFTKVMLLNLPTNLRTDWITKGYPLEPAAD